MGSTTRVDWIKLQALPGWDSTNRPLKRASVRKWTISRPCSLILMLVGYRAPGEGHRQKGTFTIPYLTVIILNSRHTNSVSHILWGFFCAPFEILHFQHIYKIKLGIMSGKASPIHSPLPLSHSLTLLLTLQLCLRWAADPVLPQDGRVVGEGEAQLGLQVKVLPAADAHRRVEHVGDVEGHAQRHIGLHQVQHLSHAHSREIDIQSVNGRQTQLLEDSCISHWYPT